MEALPQRFVTQERRGQLLFRSWSRATRTYLKDMSNKPDHVNSSLRETMAARIEIEELGDPARQKEISDGVKALDGIIGIKTEKGVLHVAYDPLATTEKKIEEAIRSTGAQIKAAATDTQGAHPDLPAAPKIEQAPAKEI
jgi:hypothetical protein